MKRYDLADNVQGDVNHRQVDHVEAPISTELIEAPLHERHDLHEHVKKGDVTSPQRVDHGEAPNSIDLIEAPVTLKAYFMAAFAAFGGFFFGFVSELIYLDILTLLWDCRR